MIKSRIAIILFVLISLPILGQNIAAFSGTKTPTAVAIPHMTAQPLSRGLGLTVASGSTFNSGNWANGGKLDTNDYIEWSVTADEGYIINITELQINYDRDPDGMSHFFTGNGPAKIRIRTSLDNYKSDIYSDDKVSNSGQSPIIETKLKSAVGGQITFRLYGFASNIGMLGPLGTFDIEGGLGNVLGLEHTGIRLGGSLTYDGLLYADGRWTPHAPNAKTANENTIIANGTYTEANHVQVKNLKVNAEAHVIIAKTGSITVNGDLSTSNQLTLKSDADNFSSLIVTGEVTGAAKYERHIQTQNAMGVVNNEVLISAPLSGETFKVFRKSNPNVMSNAAKSNFSFGPFNKSKGNFTNFTSSENETFKAGVGYKTTVPKNESFTFTGMVHTKDIEKEILVSGSAYSEWNLIGNPFPSYINLSEFLAANNPQLAATSAGIYSYDPEISNGWKVQNLAYLTLHPNTKLKPGQGFMVASKAKGASVSFATSMRTVGDTNEFVIRKDTLAKNVGFLKLNLSNGISNYHTDVYFNKQSTKGLDPGYDAGVYAGKTPDFAIYSHLVDKSSGMDMAVQSLPYSELSKSVVIPLGVNAPQGQEITFSITDVILPKETEVYLEDRLDNTFTLLHTNNYSIFTNSNISKTGRFFLHVINPMLSFGAAPLNHPIMYTTNGSLILHIEGAMAPNTAVSIYDLNGRLMISTQLDDKSDSKQIDLSILAGGMYIAKLRSGALEKIKKILIN